MSSTRNNIVNIEWLQYLLSWLLLVLEYCSFYERSFRVHQLISDFFLISFKRKPEAKEHIVSKLSTFLVKSMISNHL